VPQRRFRKVFSEHTPVLMGTAASTTSGYCENDCDLAGEWVPTRHDEWKNRNLGTPHKVRAWMPNTKMTYRDDGKGQGWVGDVYVHVTVTTLAPGQYEAQARIKALLWSAGDGNLTILNDGTLQVRYPSNGILEFWRRKDGRALEVLDRANEEASAARQHELAEGSDRQMRSIKLVFRRVDAMGIAWHWGLSVGESVYEIGGSMAVIGPRGVVHASTPLISPGKAALMGTQLEQFDGYVELDGMSTHLTDDEIENFSRGWVRRHPIYSVAGPNCQTFAEDLFVFLTGENLDFPKFADLSHGPEASADAYWLNPSKKPGI